MSVSLRISGTVHHILQFLVVHMCEMMISPANFFIFQSFDFGVFQRGKRAKNDLKLPISVCFSLYLRNCRSYHQEFDNDIYRCFFFIFFKKKFNMANIKIILFLLAYFSFFNNYLFSNFINECQKEILRCVPHLLHMFVIFN